MYMQYAQTEVVEIIISFLKNLSVVLTLGLTAGFGWQLMGVGCITVLVIYYILYEIK